MESDWWAVYVVDREGSPSWSSEVAAGGSLSVLIEDFSSRE